MVSAQKTQRKTLPQTKKPTANLDLEMNWKFLEDCWPLEERPESLKVKKYVAKLSSEKIRSYFKLWQEGQKANKRDSDAVVKDTKPKEMTFREGIDNSFTHLHPARFCRFPPRRSGELVVQDSHS